MPKLGFGGPTLTQIFRIPLPPFDIRSRALAGVSVICCPVFRNVVFSLHTLPVFMISLWALGFADARFESDANHMVRAVTVSVSCQARWMALLDWSPKPSLGSGISET